MSSEPTIVPISVALRPFVEAALLRLTYLYPTAKFAVADEGVTVEARQESDLALLRTEICRAIYREKIYAETLPLRRSLVDAITAK